MSPEAALLALHGGMENVVRGKLLCCLQNKFPELCVIPEYNMGNRTRADIAILACAKQPEKILAVIELKHNFLQQLGEIVGPQSKKRKGVIEATLDVRRKQLINSEQLIGVQIITERIAMPSRMRPLLKYPVKNPNNLAAKRPLVNKYFCGKPSIHAMHTRSHHAINAQTVGASVKCQIDIFVVTN